LNLSRDREHFEYGLFRIALFLDNPNEFKSADKLSTPDGSPIGENFCGGFDLESAEPE
jgi:hypothetical protein